jgi:PII-like signaling protein
MAEKIKSHSLGRLCIYIAPADKIRHGDRTMFRKLFPRSAYIHIITEAKKDGILNASAFNTHFGYSDTGSVQSFSAEGDNSRLSMCIELLDKSPKLEAFFLRHKDILKDKVVIYKEVEFWDFD